MKKGAPLGIVAVLSVIVFTHTTKQDNFLTECHRLSGRE